MGTADFDIDRVLIDCSSASNILTWEAFVRLKISLERLKAISTPFYGRVAVIPEGTVELPVTLGTYPTGVMILAKFLVAKTPMAYNAI